MWRIFNVEGEAGRTITRLISSKSQSSQMHSKFIIKSTRPIPRPSWFIICPATRHLPSGHSASSLPQVRPFPEGTTYRRWCTVVIVSQATPDVQSGATSHYARSTNCQLTDRPDSPSHGRKYSRYYSISFTENKEGFCVLRINIYWNDMDFFYPKLLCIHFIAQLTSRAFCINDNLIYVVLIELAV